MLTEAADQEHAEATSDELMGGLSLNDGDASTAAEDADGADLTRLLALLGNLISFKSMYPYADMYSYMRCVRQHDFLTVNSTSVGRRLHDRHMCC